MTLPNDDLRLILEHDYQALMKRLEDIKANRSTKLNLLTQIYPTQRSCKTVYISFLGELFEAARNDTSFIPVIKEALSILNGQDIDNPNPDTQGAVHWICLAGDIDIARYVLDNFKVDVNKLDWNGETGAHYLIHDHCNEDNIIEFIKLLQDKGFNADITLMQDDSIKAQTLLQKCITYNYMDKELLKTAEFLLSKSCNCNPDALMYLPNKPNKTTIREYVNKYRSKKMKEIFARFPPQTQ